MEGPPYAKSNCRVNKDDLYMILALWMEQIAETPKDVNQKVGAVLVLPNDIVCAADCSRDNVHAVARLLMKHYDKAEGSKMFMSRKPCPMCAKLLVQSKVKRVLFLPFEPEYYQPNEGGNSTDNDENQPNKDENYRKMKEVDNLFTASPIGQTRFVLKVQQSVLDDAKQKAPQSVLDAVEAQKKKLIDKFGFDKNPKWTAKSIKEHLPWAEYEQMEKQVKTYFNNAMEWIAIAEIYQGRGLDCVFKRVPPSVENSVGFNPEKYPDQARHFITMARFLSERTDDPKRGVGAVIVSYEQVDSSDDPSFEILSFGWNGFPLKALYGEFPRASDDNTSIEEKKYPYIIHAEQNALLMRNNKNVKNAVLFVTKSPCNECTPLIKMQGIKTFVVDDKKDVLPDNSATQPRASPANTLGYNMFADLIKQGPPVVCFQTEKKPE